jgi:hypothetical protein
MNILYALLIGGLLFLASANGQGGYEGQPGNQGGGSGGQGGYEGQPGNQSNGGHHNGDGLNGYEGRPGNQGN